MVGNRIERTSARLPRSVGKLTPQVLLDRTGGQGFSAYGKPAYILYPNGSSLLFTPEGTASEVRVPSHDRDPKKTVSFQLSSKDRVGVDQSRKNLIFYSSETENQSKAEIAVGPDYGGVVVATTYPKSPKPSSTR